MDRSRTISEQLVRLVQVIFGLVIAQTLVAYKDVFLHPQRHPVALGALLIIFYTVVRSWIDWHTTMEYSPYDTKMMSARLLSSEELRLWCDLAVVIAYAYLLFALDGLVKSEFANISWHLFGYFLVFAGYYLSGQFRRLTYGKSASRRNLIAYFCVWTLLLWAVYRTLARAGGGPLGSLRNLNILFIVLFGASMLVYRAIRIRMVGSAKEPFVLKVGVDMDGVIANQIDGLLPHIYANFGVPLTYDQVKLWNLPVENTNIAVIIKGLMEGDDHYVSSMRPHAGAAELMESLAGQGSIVTARPDAAMQGTKQWLKRNGIKYRSIIACKEATKSQCGLDVLIDDYIGNIEEFLSNSEGKAILVDQPWNRDRSGIGHYLDSRRLFVIQRLSEASPLLREMQKEWRPETVPGLAGDLGGDADLVSEPRP